MNDGVITFDVKVDTSQMTIVEDFENMPLATTQSDKGVRGVFAKWDFAKCGVDKPAEGSCDGHQAVGMIKPSQITTSAPLNIMPYLVEFTVYNPTSTDANFKLSYSLDHGETWVTAGNTVITPLNMPSSFTIPTFSIVQKLKYIEVATTSSRTSKGTSS